MNREKKSLKIKLDELEYTAKCFTHAVHRWQFWESWFWKKGSESLLEFSLLTLFCTKNKKIYTCMTLDVLEKRSGKERGVYTETSAGG